MSKKIVMNTESRSKSQRDLYWTWTSIDKHSGKKRTRFYFEPAFFCMLLLLLMLPLVLPSFTQHTTSKEEKKHWVPTSIMRWLLFSSSSYSIPATIRSNPGRKKPKVDVPCVVHFFDVKQFFPFYISDFFTRCLRWVSCFCVCFFLLICFRSLSCSLSLCVYADKSQLSSTTFSKMFHDHFRL